MIVEDNQLSLAIGKKGQNVRLAAKLTGWRIDIKSEEEKRREVEKQFGDLESGAAAAEAEPEAVAEAGAEAVADAGAEAVADAAAEAVAEDGAAAEATSASETLSETVEPTDAEPSPAP